MSENERVSCLTVIGSNNVDFTLFCTSYAYAMLFIKDVTSTNISEDLCIYKHILIGWDYLWVKLSRKGSLTQHFWITIMCMSKPNKIFQSDVAFLFARYYTCGILLQIFFFVSLWDVCCVWYGIIISVQPSPFWFMTTEVRIKIDFNQIMIKRAFKSWQTSKLKVALDVLQMCAITSTLLVT